jgi:CDP-4-dehydro-6-deoxyglucose reductase
MTSMQQRPTIPRDPIPNCKIQLMSSKQYNLSLAMRATPSRLNWLEKTIPVSQFMPVVQLVSGHSFQSNPGETILEAATKAEISIPYSCKIGRCNSCRVKVISGESYATQCESGLTEQELREGWILSCARAADTDLTIDVELMCGANLPRPKVLPCRISGLERLGSRVIRVELRLPPTPTFKLFPGQYVEVTGLKGIRRSYSVASVSESPQRLELHVGFVDGGAMSSYWFNDARVNDLLRIYGPLGTFFMRDITSLDVMFLATGTGIAPIQAMLYAIAKCGFYKRPRSVTVFWGGRTLDDFYIDVKSLPGEHVFIPVLSEASGESNYDVGYVQNVLIQRAPELNNIVVYASGSDSMIKSARALLSEAGLPTNRFFSDSFVCSS